jgi:hypothetical protein
MVIWNILREVENVGISFGIFYGHMVYFLAILWSFDVFSPVLVCFTKENLATLSTGNVNIHYFAYIN